MLDEYLTISIAFLNITPFFMVGLKKCGRVTTTRITKILVSNFFKAIKGAWWMPWV